MEQLDLYKCEVCGNIVEVVINGGGELICCGQPMKKLEPKDSEIAMLEKHIPVFIKHDDNVEIRVGEVLHPMINEHYIMFIEAISDGGSFVQRKYLYPSQEPKMFLKEISKDTIAREYCNIHGLWEGKND